MKFVRDTIITTQSAAGNLTSPVLDSNQLLSISLQAIATGTIVGTVKLQFSDDQGSPLPTVAAPANWSDVPSASVAVSSAGVFAIGKTDLCYRWLRVVYTSTSGTGNLTVNINALSL